MKRRYLTHGMSKLPEYHIWKQMLQRCGNPKCSWYRIYGAVGVKVCDRWKDSFANFISDMGRRPSAKHSIDRFPDNNGNYEPGNCRWATTKEQGSNRRMRTHCMRGHAFTPENTAIRKDGYRNCLICWKRSLRAYYRKNRTKILAQRKSAKEMKR